MCSINHEKKAIFIHIPKTAGMYIRSVLSEYYNFEIYLFKRPDHEIFCKTNLEYNNNIQLFFANNFYGIIEYYKTNEYLNNLMDMDEEKWNTYYKFCFIRNPYDRIISGWNYIQETEKLNIDFDKYLTFKDIVSENEYFNVFLSQYSHMINEKKEFFINFIGKFENLEEDFEKILLNIGFKKKEIIHKKNKKINKRIYDYTIKDFDQNTLNIVNNICSIDFEKFDYLKLENINNIS